MPRMLVRKCVETFACNWRQYIHQDSPVMSFAVIWHCRLCKSLYCCLFKICISLPWIFGCWETPWCLSDCHWQAVTPKSPSLFFSLKKFNLTWLSFQPAEARNRNGTESCLWLYANLDVGEQNLFTKMRNNLWCYPTQCPVTEAHNRKGTVCDYMQIWMLGNNVTVRLSLLFIQEIQFSLPRLFGCWGTLHDANPTQCPVTPHLVRP